MNAPRPLAVAALCAALAVPALAQKGAVAARLGLEVSPPKGWVELPGGGTRGQCVMMFASPRALTPRGRGATHTPNLRILFFASGQSDAGDEVDGLPRRTPFRDLDDYVARGLGQGARIVGREAGKAGDFEGRRFVAEIPGEAGARTVLGIAIPRPDGELVAAVEVLSEHLDKERKELERALDGLGAIAVDERASARPLAPWRADPGGWQGLDEAGRREARSAFATAAAAATEAAPGIGSKIHKSRVWTVASAAEAGFTKKAIAAAEAAHAWCEQHLAGISDRPSLPAVLRIFASPEQYAVFKAGDPDPREYSRDQRELYFFDDPNAGTTDGYGMLFRAVVWHWIDDRAPDALAALPRWLDNGLWEYFRSTRLKGKKIEFTPSEVENGRIAYYRQKDLEMPAIWNLVQESMQPSPEGGANEDIWGYTPECARLVRWLCEHGGGEAFGKPDLLADYLRGLGEAHRTVGPEPTRDVDAARLGEAQVKTMNQRFYAWRDSVLKTCNDAVLPLSVDAWKATNDRWLKFNADFK
jgi:hypothetical protein